MLMCVPPPVRHVEPPQPLQVYRDGNLHAGWLHAWRRDGDGWRTSGTATAGFGRLSQRAQRSGSAGIGQAGSDRKCSQPSQNGGP